MTAKFMVLDDDYGNFDRADRAYVLECDNPDDIADYLIYGIDEWETIETDQTVEVRVLRIKKVEKDK